MPVTGSAQFGLTGLAVMGQQLARNMARHDIPIAVHNRTSARTTEFMRAYGDEGRIIAADGLEEFVAAVERPRRLLIMVKAGPPVDAVLDELLGFLDEGDIVIDGGNSFFEDTRRRELALRDRGLHFMGTGISGGEDGALKGPSIMPGGSKEAYAAVSDVLTTISAQVDGTPCCTHVGTDGAGHYVKMVHNGIEYADLQLIAESYDLLHRGLGMDSGALAEVYAEWNDGDLDSFLIETTATVLAKQDPSGTGPLVDVILDEAEQKGTGRWTAQNALELGVPITGITEAVFARALSSRQAERVTASKVLPGPGVTARPGDGFVDDVRDALYASKVIAYAQGFEQIATAADTYHWDIDLGSMATIWRGGCIIRAKFLDRIKEAYEADRSLRNLLLADYFRDAVADAQDSWRRVVRAAVEMGIPTPALSSSLAFYDGYRSERLPANLIQGLRDYFGAHTYRRTDRDGSYHIRWTDTGQEERRG
jgi:6-phosphogluconate dehydrogenase